MNRKKGMQGLFRFFKLVYLRLFRIDDTPQKIAAGLGVGVFFGVLPGTGPIIALVVAFVMKVNRISALLGSILTNTWLSIPVFLLSVKAGSIVTGSNHMQVHHAWTDLLKNFKFSALFELSIYKVVIPIMIGYLIISFIIALIAYLITLIVVHYMRRKKIIKPAVKNGGC